MFPALLCVSGDPEAGPSPGSSSTSGWQRFPVLLGPQSNRRFYRSPLRNCGSPGEGESADLRVTPSSLCQSAIDTITPSLNSAAHSWLNAAQLTLAGICWGLLQAEGLLGWVTGLRPGSLSSTCVCSGAQTEGAAAHPGDNLLVGHWGIRAKPKHACALKAVACDTSTNVHWLQQVTW